MKTTLKYLATTITFACFPWHCAGQQVPGMHSEALDKSAVTFPQKDSRKPILLVIGFSHESEKQCDTWNDRLKPAYMTDSRVAYYELADFQGVPSFIMRFILHGMRRKIPKDEHAHFVPFYSGEAEWKSLVTYSSPKDAYVVIADANGRVLWQAHGVPNNVTYSELQSVLKKEVTEP